MTRNYDIEDIAEILTSDAKTAKPVLIVPVRRVEELGSCWIVISHRPNLDGYPLFKRKGAWKSAARYMLEQIGFNIPDGYDASHLCEVPYNTQSRACVNPDHVIVETHRGNMRRSFANQSKPLVWHKLGRQVGTALAIASIAN
jgi:hypothetical protein